ncbi:TatD family hydrolase [Pseudomonas anguilliseptica]|uniref:TatD family hydrolase n=1 Tax=Pseudomonas anguilliseptica TaxID=53406 RepID=A0A1H5AQT0_PSEAG|nr:TatD family hydrolase [Pseudomonas anguilliseptica]
MRLIDTHTHLDFPDFDADRAELLARCRDLGVERLVVLGVHQANWQRVWDLLQTEDCLHAAFGLHPVYLDEHRPKHLGELHDWLARCAGHPKLCAVGEFGLDYFLEQLDRERQQQLFEAQLKLAIEFELPALLHVRRAHAATIATLKRLKPPRGGIIHAFAGSTEEAREYLKLGFKLGLGGAPTLRRRCGCARWWRNCRWRPSCWKPTHPTWRPPCTPTSVIARNICRTSAQPWPNYAASARMNWPAPAAATQPSCLAGIHRLAEPSIANKKARQDGGLFPDGLPIRRGTHRSAASSVPPARTARGWPARSGWPLRRYVHRPD